MDYLELYVQSVVVMSSYEFVTIIRNLIAEMEGAKNVRLKMYVDDGIHTEARLLRSQFIRVSLYPINKR